MKVVKYTAVIMMEIEAEMCRSSRPNRVHRLLDIWVSNLKTGLNLKIEVRSLSVQMVIETVGVD